VSLHQKMKSCLPLLLFFLAPNFFLCSIIPSRPFSTSLCVEQRRCMEDISYHIEAISSILKSLRTMQLTVSTWGSLDSLAETVAQNAHQQTSLVMRKEQHCDAIIQLVVSMMANIPPSTEQEEYFCSGYTKETNTDETSTTTSTMEPITAVNKEEVEMQKTKSKEGTWKHRIENEEKSTAKGSSVDNALDDDFNVVNEEDPDIPPVSEEQDEYIEQEQVKNEKNEYKEKIDEINEKGVENDNEQDEEEEEELTQTIFYEASEEEDLQIYFEKLEMFHRIIYAATNLKMGILMEPLIELKDSFAILQELSDDEYSLSYYDSAATIDFEELKGNLNLFSKLFSADGSLSNSNSDEDSLLDELSQLFETELSGLDSEELTEKLLELWETGKYSDQIKVISYTVDENSHNITDSIEHILEKEREKQQQ